MFSRKKAVEIPPVEQPASRPPPSNRSLLSSSRAPPSNSSIRSQAAPSYSSRGGRYNDTDAVDNRQELFKGARAPPRSFVDRDMDEDPRQRQRGAMDDEDEEVEAIKHQIRFTKQETVGSSRNALRIAREAEETARNTMNRLVDQSDRLANADNHLDLAKSHASRADDQQKEIVALNRSIFRPNITFNKKGKRDAEEQRILNRHQEEKEEREEVRRQQMESRERASGALRAMDEAPKKGGLRSRLAEKSRYQFENTASDDELENELDDNMDEIAGVTSRLNMMSRTMGDEIQSQNKKLDSMTAKTDKLDSRIYGQTERLKRIK